MIVAEEAGLDGARGRDPIRSQRGRQGELVARVECLIPRRRDRGQLEPSRGQHRGSDTSEDRMSLVVGPTRTTCTDLAELVVQAVPAEVVVRGDLEAIGVPALLLLQPGRRADQSRLPHPCPKRGARRSSGLPALSSETQKDELQTTVIARFDAHVGEAEALHEVCVCSIAFDVVAGVENRAVVVEVGEVVAGARGPGGSEEVDFVTPGGAIGVGVPGAEAAKRATPANLVLLVGSRAQTKHAADGAIVQPGRCAPAKHLEAIDRLEGHQAQVERPVSGLLKGRRRASR